MCHGSFDMKVCLINPPQVLNTKYGRPYLFQPLGLLYVAAVLEKDHDVVILDASLEGWRNLRVEDNKYHLGLSPDEVYSRLRDIQPDVVGVSVPFSINAASAHIVCAQAKRLNKGVITIMGGPHPSVHPEEALADANVDYVVLGEGEQTAKELVSALAASNPDLVRSIPGIGYRSGGGPVINPRRPPLLDLDTLPFPARHLYPMEEYFNAMASGGGARSMYTFSDRWITLITSRGCPYGCNFCSIHLTLGKRFRGRSPENVLAELKHAVEVYGIKHVNFEDDNLTLDRDRAKRLFSLIAGSPLKFSWSTPNGIRADTLDEDLVVKMKESGCKRVFVAPESGDQRVVDTIIGKRQDLSKVYDAVKLFKKHGIIVDGSFVLGSIGETPRNILRTIFYAKKLKHAGMNLAGFHMATPYYGTPLYEEAKGKGFLRDDSAELLTTWEPLISTPQLSSKTLYRMHQFAQWYVNLGFLDKIKFLIYHYLPSAIRGASVMKRLLKYGLSVPVRTIGFFREWAGLVLNSARYLRMKKKGELPRIENVVYEVTNACNSRCKHCHMWENEPVKDMLTHDDLEAILRQDIFSALKVVLLTGGEPVLRQDIKDLVSAIHRARPSAAITLSTNGILFERVLDVARFAIKEGIRIDYGVSLDGVGESHNSSRGIKDNFERVDKLLRQLTALKAANPDAMGCVLIGHTLSNLTAGTLSEVKKYAQEMKLPFITQLYEQFSYYGNQEAETDVQSYKKAVNPVLVSALGSLPPSFHNEILLAAVNHTLQYNCAALSSFFVLKPNGDVSPCLSFSDIVVGNVKSTPVAEVWHSSKAKAAREVVAKCHGCSNSWATMWSFRNWPYPFIPMRMRLALKEMLHRLTPGS